MYKWHLLGWAAALTIAGSVPAAALDNGGSDATRCTCFCDLGSDRPVIPNLVFDAGGFGCSALEGRTCNVEDPRQPGLVRSGRVQLCEPLIQMEQSAVPGGQGGWVADPGSGAQGGWSGRIPSSLPDVILLQQ